MPDEMGLKGPARLVQLLPGEDATPLKFNRTELTTAREQVFDALVCLHSDDEVYSADNDQAHISDNLQDALRQMRSSQSSRLVWNADLCIDQSNEEEQAAYAKLLKSIYMLAKCVIVWAGNHHEDDCFAVYLGAGDATTTSHAFDFAHRLAQAPLDQIPEVLQEIYLPTNVHSWVYLMRIISRPFFRSLLLLRTNYISDIASVVVQCSEQKISWVTLQTAAERLFVAHPIPHFLLQEGFPKETKRETWQIMLADRDFLLSGIRFGFRPVDILVRLNWLKDQHPENEAFAKRLTVHLGYCGDIYPFPAVLDDVKAAYAALGPQGIGEVKIATEATAFTKASRLPPSLSFEGFQLRPPEAEHQAPFVHRRINRRREIGLLVLLPAESLSAPIQCGLVYAARDDPPDFLFVTNHTFLRRALPTTGFHGVHFPVSSRHTSTILVNGQAFLIPKLQNVFLRLIRQKETAEFLFLWNVCMYPAEATMEGRDDFDTYGQIKYFMEVVGKAKIIDMYNTLEKAGEQNSRQQLEVLGLPESMRWEEWLLELLD